MQDRGFAFLAAVVLLLWPAPEPDEQPRFRSGVNTVEIYATVVDGAGRLVPDLSRDDFEVLHNGVRASPVCDALECGIITLRSDDEAVRRGGFVILRERDDFGETCRRLVEEIHRQYVLGFTPRGPAGGKHNLTVTVTRPGLAVRARQTYDFVPAK